MGKIKKYIDNPRLLYCLATSYGLTRFVPDEKHLKTMFKSRIGRELDLDEPSGFNEKLQWLKLHDRNPLYTKLVDKYAVKEWVSDKIGSQYVTETYAKWEHAEDVDISGLPEKFVLKTNHDCGGVVICSDRESFDLAAAKRKLAKHLKCNYFYGGREWPYKNVEPCIFAEEYLEPDSLKNDLVDYKIMCFGGKARCAFSCEGRGDGDLRVDFFDLDWNRLPFKRHYPNSDLPVPRPAGFSRMVELSEKLSEGIHFVRVDFYEVGTSLYFGEMTFYPGFGMEEFDPEEWDERLGSWIELPYGGYLFTNDEMTLWLHPEGFSGCGSSSGSSDLPDYKLFRFSNGRIVTLAMTDRFTGSELTKTFFDEKWCPLDISEGGHPRNPGLRMPRDFVLMKQLADELVAGFPFARVDFYESGGQLYFGEITFYPNSGFECFNPVEWDERFGSWIDLPV